MFQVQNPFLYHATAPGKIQHQGGTVLQAPLFNPMGAPQAQGQNPLADLQQAGIKALMNKMGQPQMPNTAGNPLAPQAQPTVTPQPQNVLQDQSQMPWLTAQGQSPSLQQSGYIPSTAGTAGMTGATSSSMWPTWLTGIFGG